MEIDRDKLSDEMLDLFVSIKKKSREKDLHLVNSDILDILKEVEATKRQEMLLDVLSKINLNSEISISETNWNKLMDSIAALTVAKSIENEVATNVDTKQDEQENELVNADTEVASNDVQQDVNDSMDEVSVESIAETEAVVNETESRVTSDTKNDVVEFEYSNHYNDDEHMKSYEDAIGNFIKCYVANFPTSADFFIVGNQTLLIATAFSQEDASFLAESISKSTNYNTVDVMSHDGLIVHIDTTITNSNISDVDINDIPSGLVDAAPTDVTAENEDDATSELEQSIETPPYESSMDDYNEYEDEDEEYEEEENEDIPYYEDDFLDEIPDGSEKW